MLLFASILSRYNIVYLNNWNILLIIVIISSAFLGSDEYLQDFEYPVVV
jgi:hypothetical protein